jgi:predicted  nucleic acid-binding Zn-ribbon protein
MSAYLNALYEEGTRTELFNELAKLYQKNIELEIQLKAALDLAERHMNEKHTLRKQLEEKHEEVERLRERNNELAMEIVSYSDRIANLEGKP